MNNGMNNGMDNGRSTDDFMGTLKNGIWLLGVSSWLFGITDRSIASLSDGYLSAIDLMQLLTASFFFLSWLLLKPASFKLLPWAPVNRT